MPNKTEKELAFLEDLYVATDWGEQFAEMVDQHVKLPQKGHALYVGAGSGGHALALQQKGAADLQLLCVDESKESLELARAKAVALNEQTEFHHALLDDLSLLDDQFDLVLGNASMVATSRLPRMLAELVRVAKPGAIVAVWLATLSSFGEFFSIYWEALTNVGVDGVKVETLITSLPAVSDLETTLECEGLEGIKSWTNVEEFDYESSDQFLNAPLIADFLMPGWLHSLSAETQTEVAQEIARIIDDDRHEAEFSLSVKATLLVGRKAELPVAG